MCVCVRERERERGREGERNCSSHSQDNRVVVWDIRKANGPLMTLDQHNGGSGASNNASGIGQLFISCLFENDVMVCLQ